MLFRILKEIEPFIKLSAYTDTVINATHSHIFKHQQIESHGSNHLFPNATNLFILSPFKHIYFGGTQLMTSHSPIQPHKWQSVVPTSR